MDKSLKYRQIIKEVLLAATEGTYGGKVKMKNEAIIDEERGHYLLQMVGWLNGKFGHGFPIHIDLVGNKVHLRQDQTDMEIRETLLEKGVASEDLIIGWPQQEPVTI